MELYETVTYLAAAAASDAPIDGREKDLMRHLLPDFGADGDEARKLVNDLPVPFDREATLDTLKDRAVGLKLLRALLVIAYCDGSFDQEELPFLTPIVDRFSISSAELNRAKLQALYFLRLDPPSVKVSGELVSSEDWDSVCRQAHQQHEVFRQQFYQRFQDELDLADEETCYLALAVGPPSFDTEHTRTRFMQTNPDSLHMDEKQVLQLLRDEAEKKLRDQWDSAYASRCNFCYLEAPGKRRDNCPRCQGEYGVAARR
jgi:hypothetical protein